MFQNTSQVAIVVPPDLEPSRAIREPQLGELEAFTSLLHVRLQARAKRLGRRFEMAATRALARRLLQKTPATYECIQSLLGGRDMRDVRSLIEHLRRIGLIFDTGKTIALVRAPVKIDLLVGSENNWESVPPGQRISVQAGESLRVVVRSQLSLQLRVYRILHRIGGGTARRSISVKSLSTGRPTIVEIGLGADDDEYGQGIEQLLVHLRWSCMCIGDENLARLERDLKPSDVHEQIENERHDLIESVGEGWVTEYLLPRRA